QLRRWLHGLDQTPGNIDLLFEALSREPKEQIILGVSEIKRLQELGTQTIQGEALHRLALLIWIGGLRKKRAGDMAATSRAKQKKQDRFKTAETIESAGG